MKSFLLKYKNAIPYFVFFVVSFIINVVSFSFIPGDDTVEMSDDIISLVSTHFTNVSTWSSRTIVNLVASIILSWSQHITEYIFLILNSLMYTLLTYSLSGTAVKSFKCDFIKASWIASGIVLTFPIAIMSSAGWIGTSVSYMWPAASAAFFWNQYIGMENKKPALFIRILMAVALLYSVNLEGLSVLSTVIFLGIIILQIQKKSLKPHTLIYSVICIIGFLSHLLSPGNSARYDIALTVCFPDFEMLGFVDRFELVMSKLTVQLLFNFDVVFVLFSIVLCIAVHYITSDRFYRNISILPLGFSLGFPFLQRLGLYTGIASISPQLQANGSIRVDNCNRIAAYLIPIIGVLTVISIMVSLFIIFIDVNIQTAVVVLFAFVGGIGSYFVMMFSPTIWASGDRPMMAMYLMIMGVTVFIAAKTIVSDAKSLTLLERITTCMCVLTILNEIASY